MATVASPVDIYDPETVFESAAKVMLTTAGITNAYRSQDVAIDRPRPRVEIVFTDGSEIDFHHELATNAEEISNTFNGTLALQVIVDSNDWKSIRLWRAVVRDQMAHWRTALDALLPFYSMIYCRRSGAAPVFQLDKGYLASTLRYSLSYALLPGCITELDTAEGILPLSTAKMTDDPYLMTNDPVFPSNQ